jgi:hypothetical protein
MKCIGHARITHGRDENAYKILASLKRTNRLGVTSVNGRILLKPILQEEVWIQLAQKRGHWRALIIRVTNMPYPMKGGELFDQLIYCQLLKNELSVSFRNLLENMWDLRFSHRWF